MAFYYQILKSVVFVNVFSELLVRLFPSLSHTTFRFIILYLLNFLPNVKVLVFNFSFASRISFSCSIVARMFKTLFFSMLSVITLCWSSITFDAEIYSFVIVSLSWERMFFFIGKISNFLVEQLFQSLVSVFQIYLIPHYYLCGAFHTCDAAFQIQR